MFVTLCISVRYLPSAFRDLFAIRSVTHDPEAIAIPSSERPALIVPAEEKPLVSIAIMLPPEVDQCTPRLTADLGPQVEQLTFTNRMP